MLNKLKLQLLQIWYKILTKYASKQVENLQRDFTEILLKCECFEEWYNLLLGLYIAEHKDSVTITSETSKELLLTIKLEKNKSIQLPLTQYTSMIKNVLEIPTKKSTKLISHDTSVNTLYRYLLHKVLNQGSSNE